MAAITTWALQDLVAFVISNVSVLSKGFKSPKKKKEKIHTNLKFVHIPIKAD